MVETETHLYFWNGIYSQWHLSPFVIDGLIYYTAEHYMMASKARLFKDEETLQLIMDAKSPRDQKRLGRQVKNFDENLWNKLRLNIVVNGNVRKFTQNQFLKEKLLNTGNKILVEASPYDKIWGVGLKEDDPKILNEENWKGLNLLGKALVKTRTIIKKQEEILMIL